MNFFTASNGITVYAREGGTVQFQHATRAESCGILQVFPHSEWWDALREFFRAEEDERLGRWRWPENPDYVVYPPDADDETEALLILFEPGGGSSRHYTREWLAGVTDPAGSAVARCAQAYFDAHPEPKPWHEAQIDEVWLLTIDGVEEAYRTEMVSHVRFFAIRAGNGMTYGTRPSEITAGRRIYPVSS